MNSKACTNGCITGDTHYTVASVEAYTLGKAQPASDAWPVNSNGEQPEGPTASWAARNTTQKSTFLGKIS